MLLREPPSRDDLDLASDPIDLYVTLWGAPQLQLFGNAYAQDQLRQHQSEEAGETGETSGTGETGAGAGNPLLSAPEGEADGLEERQGLARDVALGELARGVRETGPDTGPEVDAYLASAGHEPGNAWCGSFVSWCMQRAGLRHELGGDLAGAYKAFNFFLYQDYGESDAELGRNPELRALRREHEAAGSTRQLFLVRRPDGELTPGAEYIQDRAGRYDPAVAAELEENTFTPDQLPLRPGDVVMFGGRGGSRGRHGHVAMVDAYDPETGLLTVVEGNNEPGVSTRTIPLEDWIDSVTGFGRPSSEDFSADLDEEELSPPADAVEGELTPVEEAPEEEVITTEGDPEQALDAGAPHRLRDIKNDPAAWQTRYDLVERFLDAGFEQGGRAPKHNEEVIPADLVEACVQTGNWDLVILFVGMAEWGVDGVPEELQDPYQDDGASLNWAHTVRTGKSVTDYDPWGAQGGSSESHGGLGIAHLDSGRLRQIYQITRGQRIQRDGQDAFFSQDLRDRDGNVLPWPEELVAPDITEELIEDGVKFDGIRARWPDADSEPARAYRDWAFALTRSRDAQHMLIDLISETFIEDGLFIEEGDDDWEDAYEDPYLRAMYGAVVSSTTRGGFEGAVDGYDPDEEERSIFEVAAEGANHGGRRPRTRGYAAWRAAELIRYYRERAAR